MASRVPKQDTTKVDLTKPVTVAPAEDGCFGREWDMRTNECSVCADNLVCGIVFSENGLKDKVREIEEKNGGFLDEIDFGLVDEEEVVKWIKSGKTTTKELIAHVAKAAKCRDNVAVVEWIKRFVRSRENVYTKDGLVWLR